VKTRLKWFPLIVGVWMLLASPVAADSPCNQSGNLTYNCRLDSFVDRTQGGAIKQVPDGWAFFVLMGDPEMRPSIDTLWGAPSQEIWSDGGAFTAGIYQQVGVTPGVVYQANIGWAAPTKPDFERKLGLDPKGGSDPLAPSVIWGPASWEVTPMPDLTVSARAEGETMTLFVWVHHPHSHGVDQVFLDDLGLWPDPSQPAATVTPVPSPTPTARPPTRTPSPLPPTDTATPPPPSPIPTDTPTPVQPPETATVTPTPTPLPPTATPTPLPPTETPTPTWTPTATPVTIARVAFTATVGPAVRLAPSSGAGGRAAPILLYVAGAALSGAILLGTLLLVMWARGRRAVDGESR
jgi:hypothetical protein